MNKSYKGKILISTPDASGDIFSRSVVLVVDHNENGAFGLILNKLNSKATDHLSNQIGFEVPIYEGGPVENNKIFFIVKGNPTTKFQLEIGSNFYLTEDAENIIKDVVESNISLRDIKVFSGYSGWSANQLETEVENKNWEVLEVYNLDYTYPNDVSLWKTIMQNLGGNHLLWANSPEDISLN